MAIVRTSITCLTCDQSHTLRIGMGQEDTQRHTFDCRGCGEAITVRMDVNYETLATPVTPEKNASLSEEVSGAPIVNLDAMCLIPPGADGVDMTFFRMDEFRKTVEKAIERGSFASLPSDPELLKYRPYRRPDHKAEWGHIRRVWSLQSRGRDELAHKQLKKETEKLYNDENINTLPDWLWRFFQPVVGHDYQERVANALKSLQLVSPEPLMGEYAAWGMTDAARQRGQLYLEFISEFFELHEEFSQILFYVQGGVPIDPALKTTSSAFEKVKMFYGNAFETLAPISELLAILNNVQHGRTYDQFEQLSWDDYKKLDKANAFGPFASNEPLTALCDEADNRLRNASHHRRLRFDGETQILSFGSGKGGAGKQVTLGYAEYLERCVRIAFQIFSVMLVEVALSHSSGRTFPV